MSVETVKIPDIGADSAEVTEILIEPGNRVEKEASLVVLESDKASVEVPCPFEGTVVAVRVTLGDKVSQGDTIADIDTDEGQVSQDDVALMEPDTTSNISEVSGSSESEDKASAKPIPSLQERVMLMPDIGADEAEIIEISVAVGDQITEGDAVVVAESDKASLEVPSEYSGTVTKILVQEGAKVKEGDPIAALAAGEPQDTDRVEFEPNDVALQADADIDSGAQIKQGSESVATPADLSSQNPAAAQSEQAQVQTLNVPDMGADSAEVIEINVEPGSPVATGDTLVTVETDKASMELPAELDGTVVALHCRVGDMLSQGQALVDIETMNPSGPVAAEAILAVTSDTSAADARVENQPTTQASPPVSAATNTEKPAQQSNPNEKAGQNIHAGPAVRKLARELGVDLALVAGTGQRGRIVKDDVTGYVKKRLQQPAAGSTPSAIPAIPGVDWAQFGDVDVNAMSRIQKVTALNMSRNWLNVPHVTHFDDADVTDLEQYRAYLKPEGLAKGIKMTPLAFLLKASAIALQDNPRFLQSLSESGEELVQKHFCHISLAVDTPAGLMVPVIRDVDKKDIWQLAKDVADMANKAKNGKLTPKEMQGGCFTISSLGAIGGTGFTPIVSAPQVGILGVSNTAVKPVWDGQNFIPRKMMPLALSYDHRVINGADAGRFMTSLVAVMADINRLWGV